MLKFRIFSLCLLIFTLSFSLFAQKADEKLKKAQQQELKLLEEILEDANKLKLGENRAVVYAEVGSKIWQVDKEKARRLFEVSIDELTKIQNEESLRSSKEPNLVNLIYGQMPRKHILNLIARRDAELALDMLVKSRPTKLLAILNQYGDSPNSLSKFSKRAYRYSNLKSYATSEMQLEQRFLSLAADQNPEKIVELFRRSLTKGVNYETLRLLKKLYRKEPKLANKLADEAAEQILKIDVGKNGNNSSYLIYFLNNFSDIPGANAKRLKISENLLRKLIHKVSDLWVNQNNQNYSTASSSFKLLERFYPSRSAVLKERKEKYNQQYRTQNNENKRYNELMKTNPSGETLLEEAKNFSGYRDSIYNTAIQKLVQEGQVSRVVNTIKSDFPEEEANQRLTRIYTDLANQETSKGNFDKAYSLINEIPNKAARFHPMTNLANSIYRRNREENKQYALSILGQLDSYIVNDPTNQHQINSISHLANTYAQIEPSEAFPLIEMIIDPLNEYAKAAKYMSQFRSDGTVRNGETVISSGASFVNRFNIVYTFQILKQHDFSRTMQLINRFEQPETRIAIKLKILNNISNSQITNLPVNLRNRLKVTF